MSLLVIYEFLGLFANTSTANDKYSLCDSEKLPPPVQMQLSKKQNTFNHFFASLLKSRSYFQHFEKKDDLHSLCISEITDCKRRG